MEPQNLLVIMSDEHNPKMLGCAGHPLVKTPHLDELAARGTRFDRAYTNCPICVPARASFATGRYVHDIEYWDNSIAYDGRIEGWGHRLQDAGVRVESIGKLHYRLESDPTGFDAQHIPMHIKDGVGMLHLSIRNQFPDFTPPPKEKGGGAAGIVLNAGHGESEYTRYDRRVADLASGWIRDAATRDTPWVLFVSFVTPHYPLIAPDEYFDLYPVDDMPMQKLDHHTDYRHHPWLGDYAGENARGEASDEQHRTAFAAYLGLCSFMDAMAGQVLTALGDSGAAANTRVMYTSDHGDNAGARGLWGKSNHYEEASGVPLIVAGADVPAGKLCRTPASLVDFYPSIVEAAGARPEPEVAFPGRSLFALANAPDDIERVAFSEYHAARSPSGSYMIRKGKYKYIHYVGFRPELFDLETDPEEENDLAGDARHAGVVREYEALLRDILDPDEIDRRANAAQKSLIERSGGPEAVMNNLVTTKHYTPVPDDIDEELRNA
jgi:choline-sulfatase